MCVIQIIRSTLTVLVAATAPYSMVQVIPITTVKIVIIFIILR